MAMLLREMGIDVDATKLPRTPRNGGADAYELFQLTPEYAEAVKYRQEHGREIGRAIGYHAKEDRKMENTEKVKCKEIKPVGMPEKKEHTNDALRMAIYMWGAYMEYRYGTTATKEDMEMLERLIGITSGKKNEPSARCRRLWQSVRDGRSADYVYIIPQNKTDCKG